MGRWLRLAALSGDAQAAAVKSQIFQGREVFYPEVEDRFIPPLVAQLS